MTETSDIDLVYLWVDGNDPQWRAKRDATIGKPSNTSSDCKGRFVDNDELKYSLRSIDRYAPWIRRIFIVTDGQKPAWLNTDNPRVQIVDHTQIMPPECLPCFNSAVIEHHLHLIPGLAERFIYANDDMLLYRPAMPETFFAADGFPIVRMKGLNLKDRYIALKKIVLRRPKGTYRRTVIKSADIVEKAFHVRYNGLPHHNIDAYLKSTNAHFREFFKSDIEPTLTHHGRQIGDIQRTIYAFAGLATHRAHLEYAYRRTSLYFGLHGIHRHGLERLTKLLDKYRPTFICLNDTEWTVESDREIIRQFLETQFPEKSQFEK